jgi:hypothetical protein
MRGNVLWVVVLVLAAAAVGCKKKKPAPANADPEPAPAVKADGLPAENPPPSGGGGGSGIIAAGGGIGVVNPVAALGGGGGGGAAMAVRKAARRTQALNELKNIGEIIFAMQIESGRMPTVPQILDELKRTPQLLAGITEGAYILTGTTEPGGLYAFEVDADRTPGIAVIGGRATRTTPDELRPYLAALPRPPVQAPPQQPQPQPAQAQPKQATPQPAAVFPPVNKQDMEDVRIFIDNISAGGTMPAPPQIIAALQQAMSPAHGLIQKGAIILTGVRTREGVWAYETAALQRGGLACGPGGVETLTAVELRRRLGR